MKYEDVITHINSKETKRFNAYDVVEFMCNMTCNNCKWFEQKTGVDFCINEELDLEINTFKQSDYWFEVNPEFGCNKWEQKK